mmetsp:Transcript_39088/g.98250  ORF Transcript_39088/g.98250 Transcript_39088/m.98250 type:complete len:298 (+) Transcript_39088:175-1068(+)
MARRRNPRPCRMPSGAHSTASKCSACCPPSTLLCLRCHGCRARGGRLPRRARTTVDNPNRRSLSASIHPPASSSTNRPRNGNLLLPGSAPEPSCTSAARRRGSTALGPRRCTRCRAGRRWTWCTAWCGRGSRWDCRKPHQGRAWSLQYQRSSAVATSSLCPRCMPLRTCRTSHQWRRRKLLGREPYPMGAYRGFPRCNPCPMCRCLSRRHIRRILGMMTTNSASQAHQRTLLQTRNPLSSRMPWPRKCSCRTCVPPGPAHPQPSNPRSSCTHKCLPPGTPRAIHTWKSTCLDTRGTA